MSPLNILPKTHLGGATSYPHNLTKERDGIIYKFSKNKKIKSKQFKKYKSSQTINSSKATALCKAIQKATGEIILFLTPNIKLHTHSLFLISNVIN